MEGTRARILETARGLFNEHGVHRVAVRDIARATELSPGNLAYHFPTKDDLVAALVMELHHVNAKTAFVDLPDDFSLVTLYRAARLAMHNMLHYRFVLLSYADALRASPELQKMDAALEVRRRARHDDMIERLAKNGYVDRRSFAPRAERMYETTELVSSSWLAHALRSKQRWSDRAIVLHYAKLGTSLLEPFLTPKGARQLRSILAGAHDD